MHWRRSYFFVLLQTTAATLWLGGGLQAEETGAEGLQFFETKIRPVLVEHCYRCHAADAKKIRGGLLLDTREGIRQGGDSGAAVAPGKPVESLLLDALRYETFEMPPEGPLPAAVIADFEQWIRMGAPDPRDGTVEKLEREIDIEAGREFWAFQLPQPNAPPEVSDSRWPHTNVDRFILAKLEENNLQPGADADRTTLIRRAYYALIGLPPALEEIDAFANDPQATPVAFTKIVDRLLESKHFGERWGRHWLDVARFAESSGGGRTLLFPDAWRYRDYVIKSLNNDVPYDRFVRQQIAGDLLEAATSEEKRQNLIATAFLVLGATNYELQDKEVLEMDIVDEQLTTIGTAFLGMTLGCARCHDHKFDPIPTRDYYALAGILKSTESVVHENVSRWPQTKLPLELAEEAALNGHAAAVADLEARLVAAKTALYEAGGEIAAVSAGSKTIDRFSLPGVVVDDAEAVKQGRWSSSRSVGGYVGESYLYAGSEEASITFSPQLPKSGEYEVCVTYTPHANRSPKAPIHIFHDGGESTVYLDQTKAGSIRASIETLGSFILNTGNDPRVVISNVGAAAGAVVADAVVFVPKRQEAVEQTKLVDDKSRKELLARLSAEAVALEKELKQLKANGPKPPVAMAVVDKESVSDIPLAIRGVVHNAGPIVPRGVLQVASYRATPTIPENQSGRLQLADWIASPQNPLTARIMVNRIWHWLFGRGLVRSVDNFGSMGELPSHPELLDHLAVEFIQDGWSVKRMIRRLMLSHVYQLDSASDQAAAAVDPANRLLWRMNRQRLDAECIRDTLLQIGGNLDLTMAGSNIEHGTESEYGYTFSSTRRSVYMPVFRNTLPEIMETFDFADPNIQVGMRNRSTTAPQALLMMNSPLVMEQATSAAERLVASPEVRVEAGVEAAYRQVLGRRPSDSEIELASRFLGENADVERWRMLYHALMESLDFRHVD